MNDFITSMKGVSKRIVGTVADAGAKTMLKASFDIILLLLLYIYIFMGGGLDMDRFFSLVVVLFHFTRCCLVRGHLFCPTIDSFVAL